MSRKSEAKDPEPTEEHQERVQEQVEEHRGDDVDAGPDPIIAVTGEDQESTETPADEPAEDSDA